MEAQMAAETRPTPESLAFGEALAELETIVGQLESGQLELEDSLEKYERGVALLRALQARLTDAQQKVTVLMGELESDTVADATGADDE
jgi:exodeoxyribonuclease VII small subunit